MKRNLLFSSLTVMIVLIAVGLSAIPAQAQSIYLTPAEECYMDMIFSLGSFDRGSFWDSGTQRCYIRYSDGMGMNSICYPGFNTFQAVTLTAASPRNSGSVWFWDYMGCTTFDGHGNLIIDPNKGNADLGGGATFGYEADTCDGKCQISRYGLTPPAKNALGNLPGKVIGKSYIQIRDKSGDLDFGEFTFCLPAKNAKNPAFYRYTGNGNWSYKGGWWKGDQFCMFGTMSGNYVLIAEGKPTDDL